VRVTDELPVLDLGLGDEIPYRQALYYCRRSQDQREPRGRLLERPQGHRAQAQNDSIGPVHDIDSERQHANLSSAIRLFVLGDYSDQIAGLEKKSRGTRQRLRSSMIGSPKEGSPATD
jgi:hypothetical protein